ncbi:HNH endonuclease [Pseudomonas sp. 21LCFQ010]|uniref:HNH endonuclease n=1 Tax=Pseudomonas sp. 21LCFQ010 TaxID=2957506 RepID=UPI0020972F4E|nr:HNH endonuclease signature motif containing protein [Pseudomonas sp. 21LCFQ010]MCO8160953.1 HNH endonuclease [Pseudomonas sp. 21LCFQ010]
MQLTELAGGAVAVYPAFRRVLGLSAAAAQFLSQAVYWTERTDDGWFYKTENEWLAEVGLAADEVRDSRKSLKALGVLEEQRKGIPAKMFYRVDEAALFAALEGDVPAITLNQLFELYTPKLGQLSKAGLMRAKRAGVPCEFVSYADVLRRDGLICGCCAKPIERGPGNTGMHLSFDHIQPLAAGGAHHFENLQPTHAGCRAAKGGSVAYQRPASPRSVDRTSVLSVVPTSSLTQEQPVLLPKDSRCVLDKTTITKNTQETTQEITQETTTVVQLAPARPKRAAKPRDEAEQIRQEACRRIWSAYAAAYEQRYATAPVRNAKISRQVVELRKRLGEEAVPVAEYFVWINDSYLIRSCHDLGLLLARCEAYRTQWATNRQMNATTARQLEQTQANFNAAQTAAEAIRAGEGQPNAFL